MSGELFLGRVEIAAATYRDRMIAEGRTVCVDAGDQERRIAALEARVAALEALNGAGER